MTTTTTTGDTLALSRDTLTLVRVSPDYFTTGDQHSSMPNGDDDSRTYLATASRTMGEDWATLIVGWDTDPRGRIGWALGADYLDLVEDSGQPHGGWNIRRQYLTATPVDRERPRPASADLPTGDRRLLPMAEAYPIGSRWEHTPSAATVTVLGHGTDALGPDSLHVTTGGGNLSSTWVRGALDSYGVFRGWDEEHTPEATTGPLSEAEIEDGTFTREDVTRAVAEAVAAAKREADAALEEFKESANARAVEYAQANGLCSEFERCMEDIGLMGRDEWREAHQTDYRVTFLVSVDVSASDEYEAESVARSELYEELSYPLDETIVHHSTDEA